MRNRNKELDAISVSILCMLSQVVVVGGSMLIGAAIPLLAVLIFS